LAIQLFFTGRIVVLLGVAMALALLPAMTIIGFSTLTMMPSLTTIAVFQSLRRAGDYAIARPTREILFTVLPREDRYKTKSFIDTFVYRLGDQVGAWSVTLLRSFGDNVAIVPIVAMSVAALWLVNALWLGRRETALAQEVAEPANLS
jgi:AAA family ATP:ADP antiporter